MTGFGKSAERGECSEARIASLADSEMFNPHVLRLLVDAGGALSKNHCTSPAMKLKRKALLALGALTAEATKNPKVREALLGLAQSGVKKAGKLMQKASDWLEKFDTELRKDKGAVGGGNASAAADATETQKQRKPKRRAKPSSTRTRPKPATTSRRKKKKAVS